MKLHTTMEIRLGSGIRHPLSGVNHIYQGPLR